MDTNVGGEAVISIPAAAERLKYPLDRLRREIRRQPRLSALLVVLSPARYFRVRDLDGVRAMLPEPAAAAK